MKKLALFMLMVFFTAAGCNKSSISSLTLGTGTIGFTIAGRTGKGFTITGETTSFTGSPVTIFWRLESREDMKGSTVDIVIEEKTNNGYVTRNTFNYPALQSYGHIMVSSFNHDFGKGSFRATGKLTDNNKTVASKVYTVN